MVKRKIKECENIEFLPQKFQEELKEQSDKNILSTLCCYRFRFSDYAEANGGFFYASLEEIAKESLVDDSTVKRRLALLQMKKHIERKSGTKHKCTHYKLSKEIEQLLGIEEDENYANAPLDKIREDKISLDKKRQDKTSIEKTRQEQKSTEKTRTEQNNYTNNNNGLEYKEDFKQQVEESLSQCVSEEDFIIQKGLLSKELQKIQRNRILFNQCSMYLERRINELKTELQFELASTGETIF